MTIAITTIKNDTLIAIFIPVRSLNMTLNITKLIAKDTAKKAIASMSLSIIKNTIPITNKTLEVIAMAFNILGLIRLHSLNLTFSYTYHHT